MTQLLEHIASVTGDQRSVLTSVGLTELVHGYRAQSASARIRRESFIRELLEDVEVYSYGSQAKSTASNGNMASQSRLRTY